MTPRDTPLQVEVVENAEAGRYDLKLTPHPRPAGKAK
jgi:hypothetical protein